MNARTTIPNFTVTVTLLFFNTPFIYAQTETKYQVQEQDIIRISKPDLFKNLNAPERIDFKQSLDINKFYEVNTGINKAFFFQSTGNTNSNFSFRQFRTDAELTGFGTSQWYNNQLFWKTSEKFSFGVEAGLAIQNTVIDPFIPNYEYTLGLTLVYTINDRLKAYVFGRYVSSPLNKPGDYLEPFMYNNQLFLQSGAGAGLKSTIKNMPVDFQIMSGYDSQLKIMNNFKSKVQIRF